MAETIGNRAVKGTIWAAFDRFGVMGLQFVVNLVLARLLTPADFGIIGMLYIFIAVSQVFIDGGFGSALIQKKTPTDTDYSTIFYWNLAIGSIIYGLLYVFAPWIAEFYHMPLLCKVLRVMGLSLILNGIVGLQVNRLQKQLRFNTIAISNILSYLLSAVLAIGMAWLGYGVWCLVAMMLVQPLLRGGLIFLLTKWLPRERFSKDSFRSLVAFGGFLLLGNLMESIGKNIQGLVIGRRFSSEQMGYYSQADKLDQIVSYSIPQVIASVMYPIFSQYQDDKERLRELIKMDFRIISFVIYPLLALLIVIAQPLILTLYGEKWLSSVGYFQILCCGGFFYALNNIPYYAVAACGKSKSLFALSFYKWLMFAIFILVGMNFGMDGIMWAISVSYFNIFAANCILARRYTQLPIKAIVVAILPAFLVSTSVGLSLSYLLKDHWVNWIVGGLVFCVAYLAIAYIFRVRSMKELKVLMTRIVKPN